MVLLDWFVGRSKDRQGRHSNCFIAELGESDSISFVVGVKPIWKDNGYIMGVLCGWCKLCGVLVIGEFPVAHARDTV